MDRQSELILRVVERFLFHKNYKTENPVVAATAMNMCSLEITEMWMLTQD